MSQPTNQPKQALSGIKDPQAFWLEALTFSQNQRCAVDAPSSPPLPEPAAAEHQPLLPESLQSLVESCVLDKQSVLFDDLLPRWQGYRFNARLSAALLDKSDDPTRYAACLGEHGRWLLKQIKPKAALEPMQEQDWEEGNLEARSRYLSHWRGQNAAEARAALEGVWPQENTESRASLVSALKTGLSLDDEAFLETAAKDKAKSVREAAWELLCQLPDSGFSQRMLARVLAWVSFKKPFIGAGTWTITLPEAFDKSWDGIQEKLPVAYKSEGIGEKAHWLLQALGYVPLRLLCEKTGYVAFEHKNHDFELAFWRGWELSLRRFPEAHYLKAAAGKAPRNTLNLGEVVAAAGDEAALLAWLNIVANNDWFVLTRPQSGSQSGSQSGLFTPKVSEAVWERFRVLTKREHLYDWAHHGAHLPARLQPAELRKLSEGLEKVIKASSYQYHETTKMMQHIEWRLALLNSHLPQP